MKQVLRDARNIAMARYHKARGFMAANHFDYPASAMTVIGVTGTNGKTSTCYMIYNILLQAGLKAAMMTTVSTSVMGESEEQLGHMTTADTKILNKRIAGMRDAGVQFLVLEVSSHALAQGRIFGIPISIAVMTNVTPEHLDYHRTMANYRNVKVKLFKMMAKNARHGGSGVGIVNADDESSAWFVKYAPKPISYGIDHGDLKATQIKLKTNGVEYYTRIDKQAYHIKVNIPGECYVYNSLAAVAACHQLGIKKKDIEDGIASLSGIAGRMSRVEAGQDFSVIVDYAHTPDAFLKVIPSVRQATKGKVIVVTGAAGNRDNSKFPSMGRIAGENADLVILTEEDAGKKSVRKLSELVAKGVRQAGKKEGEGLEFIDNRKKAIQKAILSAQKGDTVLLLGMGHEKVIDRPNGPEEWNDGQIAEQLIKKMLKKPAGHPVTKSAKLAAKSKK